MKNFLFLLLLSSLILGSCKQSEKNNNKEEAGNEMSQMSEHMQKAYDRGKERVEARRAKGDTLPIHFDKLKDFLPKQLKGFTPEGEPNGRIVSAQGMGFSMTEQKFKAGKDEVSIIISDYNGMPSIYSMATAMIKANVTFENNDQSLKSLNLGIDDVGAMETYNKTQKEAGILIGVGERFFVKIKVTNQENTELAETIAKTLPLKEMAAM